TLDGCLTYHVISFVHPCVTLIFFTPCSNNISLYFNVTWIIGPTAKEINTAPTPSGPPKRNPATATHTTIIVRDVASLRLDFFTIKSIKLSRGPAPKLAEI